MLDKRSKRVLWVFGIALLGIVITELVRPKPIDWRASYISTDKIPFGGFVLFEEATSLFKNTEIEKIAKDPYEFLTDSTYSKIRPIFINDEIFFDERQTDKILKYVENGNTVFIASPQHWLHSGDSWHRIHGQLQYFEEEIRPNFSRLL